MYSRQKVSCLECFLLIACHHLRRNATASTKGISKGMDGQLGLLQAPATKKATKQLDDSPPR